MSYKRKKDRNLQEKKRSICRACSNQKRATNGNYNPKEKFICSTCGKEFMEWRSQLSNIETPYCSKQCKYDGAVRSLVGNKFGKLLVLERERRYRTTFYKCQCDCGNSVEVSHSNLKEGTQSCGCLVVETRGGERKPLKEVVSKAILNFYKRNAKKRYYHWELPYDKFLELINGNCYYCGAGLSNTFTWHYKYETASLPFNGIDRLDNTIGYIIDNCVSCCRTCNSAKGELSVKEFKEWAARLANNISRL